MNVAFILPSLLNRGPNVFTKNLVCSLIGKVNEITVYYLDNKVELEFPCDVKFIRSVNQIPKNKHDIIHSTMFRPDFYLSINKRRFKNTKLVCGVHNFIKEDMVFNYGYFKGRVIARLWLFALNKFSGIVFSSDDMQSYYNSSLSLRNKIVIPYGVPKATVSENQNIEFENEILELKKEYFIIGAVGLMIERKGFHQIILALRKMPNFALVLIGDGNKLADLKEMVIKNNLSDRVLFTGFQHNSKDYYQYFDCYCMSSYSEGFGLAMLDALSIGLPLVCCDLPIYDEYFGGGKVARFKLDDIDSLVHAFELVNTEKSIYKQGSKEIYSRYFSLDVMADNHLRYYKELLSQ
ncbi:glycosyltransferase family 4 protein [Vibrio vulnificus]